MPSKIDQSESSSSNLEEKVMDLISNGAKGSGKVEIDEDLHSRQLAIYGRETMRRLFASNVLISGLNSLGADIEVRWAIRILMGSVEKDTSQGALLQNPELMKMRSLLDRSSQQGRFRVPVEAERLTDNDLVLEQYLSPMAPGLAGFRLDAFSAIKPRVTHSPSPSPSPVDVDVWQSSVTCLEDRLISPAVLYVQVSVFQEPRNYVIVGEYRLPEVRAGTALYFDFPRPIQARRLIFRLLGDVTAFADDISEQDDSNFKANPIALGLSLSNKIKLYYYADPYELGKLASLSAV